MEIKLTFQENEIVELEETTGINIKDKETLCNAVLMAIEKYIETYHK